MDEDKQELLRHLFAVATEFTESAHELASTGQSGELARLDYADLAGELRAAARNINALAEAASVIAENAAE